MSYKEQDQNPPEAFPGLERRGGHDTDQYFNQQFDSEPVLLEPDNFVCRAEKNQMYVTTVGSGVLVTFHDIELKIGAMAYVLIPPPLLSVFPHFEREAQWQQQAIKPVENCVAELKRRGAGKHRLQVRLIGGAKLPGREAEDAGTKNYIFAREYITRKGLSILNEDLGGSSIRRVHFFPDTGRAVRMILRRNSDFTDMRDLEAKNQTLV